MKLPLTQLLLCSARPAELTATGSGWGWGALCQSQPPGGSDSRASALQAQTDVPPPPCPALGSRPVPGVGCESSWQPGAPWPGRGSEALCATQTLYSSRAHLQLALECLGRARRVGYAGDSPPHAAPPVPPNTPHTRADSTSPAGEGGLYQWGVAFPMGGAELGSTGVGGREGLGQGVAVCTPVTYLGVLGRWVPPELAAGTSLRAGWSRTSHTTG